MSRFLQLHFLTAYAPSNLNRDDLGRPKTALFGGTQRLRVSSQSLKRAWRTSEGFAQSLEGHVGLRTKDFGGLVFDTLKTAFDEKQADKLAKQIAAEFGKVAAKEEGEKGRRTEQLAHITPDERARLKKLAGALVAEQREPTEAELAGLVSAAKGAADIALFGRMLAAKSQFNVEAAAQVAHAISVHRVAIEDDYFTAVDDLNTGREDSGAGHVGTQEFASAVLYHYVCVDRAQLLENLGDEALVEKTLEALGNACLSVGPNGKQASFASRALASYALVEKGDDQPRSLAVAFLVPVKGEDLLGGAVKALKDTKTRFDKVYDAAPQSLEMDVTRGEGSRKQLLQFFAGA